MASPTSEHDAQDGEGGAPVSRRAFLVGLAAVLTTAVGTVPALFRFISPAVAYEPPARFKLGFPQEFASGSVKFDDVHRVFIVREKDTFYAMDAVCTHLGCTPRWEETAGIIFCPCHGSKFTREGQNFAGPAPRPLDRLGIRLAEDGRLEVDKDRRYPPEQWSQSVLKV